MTKKKPREAIIPAINGASTAFKMTMLLHGGKLVIYY